VFEFLSATVVPPTLKRVYCNVYVILLFDSPPRRSMGCQQAMSFCLQQQTFSAHFGDTYLSVVIPIDGIFNNQAASMNGAIADFDGHGSSFDAQYLPHGSWVYDGITVRGSTVRLFEFSAHLQFHSTNFLRLGVSERTMCWRTIKSCIYPNRQRFTSFIFCMPEMELMVCISVVYL
jgi:hypothetical protein